MNMTAKHCYPGRAVDSAVTGANIEQALAYSAIFY
jgi:hypothetical protein